MLSNLAMCIQRLLESVGPILDGPVISSEIKLSLNDHSIVTIHIDSCAKSLDMEATTEASPKPSPCKPTSQSQSSLDFSQNTFTPFLLIYVGTDGLQVPSSSLDILLQLLAESDGFLEGEMILQPSGKPLHTILRAR